jgi:hypothetical protein
MPMTRDQIDDTIKSWLEQMIEAGTSRCPHCKHKLTGGDVSIKAPGQHSIARTMPFTTDDFEVVLNDLNRLGGEADDE